MADGWSAPPVTRLLPRTPPKGATVRDEEREVSKAQRTSVIRRLIDRGNQVY